MNNQGDSKSLSVALALVFTAVIGLSAGASAREHCVIGSDDRVCDVLCNMFGVCGEFTPCDTLPGRCNNDPNSVCEENADCVSPGTCTVPGGDGWCTICAYPGVDNTMIGNTGEQDMICGKSGNDVIDGKSGDDLIDGGSGEDLIDGGGGNDTIYGGGGNDSIDGEGGSDTIITGDGDDVALGGTGADIIVGSAGDDRLFGESGDDLVVGCGGRDFLSGGRGDDNVWTAAFLVCGVVDNDVGSLLCGDEDTDTLFGFGPAHQCMDGGNDPNDSCNYSLGLGRAPTNFDRGTATRCESVTGSPVDTGNASCGCE